MRLVDNTGMVEIYCGPRATGEDMPRENYGIPDSGKVVTAFELARVMRDPSSIALGLNGLEATGPRRGER